MTPKSILDHSQFTKADYEYLTTKGYSNKEIITLWNRDRKSYVEPVAVNKNRIDWRMN